jgi:hypothetical protein
MTLIIKTNRGYTYHTPASASIEEIAADVFMKKRKGPGIAYARKTIGKHRPRKESCRKRLSNLYTSRKWPGELRMLTMPGMGWYFEKTILQERGLLDSSSFKGKLPDKADTIIDCVERDEAIFRGAFDRIPTDAQGIKIIDNRSVSTALINKFIATSVEKYINNSLCPFYDVAWLDFTGPITQTNLAAMLFRSFLVRVAQDSLVEM